MGQRVDIPGVGIVEFPDTMTEADINAAIQNLNQVVQYNASTAEEIAAAAEELSSKALDLRNHANFFKV